MVSFLVSYTTVKLSCWALLRSLVRAALTLASLLRVDGSHLRSAAQSDEMSIQICEERHEWQIVILRTIIFELLANLSFTAFR